MTTDAPRTPVRIGNASVGPGLPTFVVAEMSGNHGGRLERALEIVRAAARIGADAIKLQTYTANTITLRSDREDFRLESGPWAGHRTLWDLYAAAHTPWEWHAPIFAEARSLGLEVFSSPFDESAVDLLESLGSPAYKIASPEITHVPLLRRVAATRKPVIVSTGLAELQDIELALRVLREAGAREIVVLKCTTAYPAPPEEANLLTIPDISRRFGVLAGLSDHSMGTAVPVAAVALGAVLVEKHFTLDGDEETVDSFFSLGEQEFARMVADIRLVQRAVGQVSYDIAASARASLRGRRSLYVAATVAAGEVLTPVNVKCVRPAHGLHPAYYEQVLGRRARRALLPGERLRLEDLE